MVTCASIQSNDYMCGDEKGLDCTDQVQADSSVADTDDPDTDSVWVKLAVVTKLLICFRGPTALTWIQMGAGILTMGCFVIRTRSFTL